MKSVYFVRHGITAGNEANAYQLPSIPLSEKGRAQAEFVAKRFDSIPVDVIIASNFSRADETAHIIAGRSGHKVVLEPLFHEILKPSIVRGKAFDDPEAVEAMKKVHEFWRHETQRHSDEENFHDLKNRALQALQFLEGREEERMLVVTHGTVLKMLLSVMMEGGDLSPDFFKSIDQFMFPENTGITLCEYDNTFHPNRWQLITWNDHAHLG